MDEQITSLQNERVKLARNLVNRARSRRTERKIVLEGTRLVRDAFTNDERPLYVFYDPNNANRKLIERLQAGRVELLQTTPEVLGHITDTKNPQGIIGVFKLPRPPLPQEPKRVLILDTLREPGNMGTMLRTAAASGVEVVVLSPGCVDPYNPKVLRSGMGAHFRVPVVEAEWSEIVGYCRSLQVYIAAGDGTTRYDHVDWSAAWALVIGSEAHGASEEVARLQAQHINIPMAARTESLNAGVAAGVILFEAARRRAFLDSGGG